jgi:pimeloyl-ACP methyl ester carboxylesterase
VTIARAAHQILATDISERLATISAPTLVIWGARDALLPPAYGRRLAAAIPTARFEAIEGAGHSPMWERSAEFAATLVRFLAEPRDHASVAWQRAAPAPPRIEDDEPGAPAATTLHAVLAPTGGRIAGRYLAVGEWLVHVRVGRPDGIVETAPIVFVHGYVISSRYHLPTMRRLAHQHLVLAPDLPGFGWTSKPDHALDVPGLATALVATLDAAGIGRAILVGNSLGSQVAAQVAVDHPDRVLATVLTGPTFDPAEPSLARHVLRLIAVIPHERPSLLFEHVPAWIQAGLPRAIATLRHAWSHQIEVVLPYLRSPTVIVRGEHDALVPRRWAVEAARLAPNGRALEIGGAAHALTYDAPVSLARIIEDVVASVESATRPNGDGLLPIRVVTATHPRRPGARPRRTRAGPPRP